MARYTYDVNTTQKYIDVHKQFQGGLKTVDTDDSLGAVFLRNAENVSLSEFGFIEKRYGTFENFKKIAGVTINSVLQGYWEFKNRFIYAVDGNLFIDDTRVTRFYKDSEQNYRYPAFSDIFVSFTAQTGDYEVLIDGNNRPFQNQRDVNAVNINDVLYIFTGTYPLYIEGTNPTKVFVFPVEVPTFDEIAITGHNLLEHDYDDLYFNNEKSIDTTPVQQANAATILNGEITPEYPYVSDESVLNFYFKPALSSTIYAPFDSGSPTSESSFFTISLDNLQYRNSGPGASDADYLGADITKIDFITKTNFVSGNDVRVERDAAIFRKDFDTLTVKNTNDGTANERFTYKIRGSFNISKKDFLQEPDFKLRFFKTIPGSSENVKFNAYDYDYPSPVEGVSALYFIEEPYYIITPVDEDGTVYTGNSVEKLFDLSYLENNGEYNLVVPSENELNMNANIASYNIEFFEHTAEWCGTNTPLGPTNMEDEPDLYSFKVIPTETFSRAVTLEQTISLQNENILNFSFTDLVAGIYDFKVTFALKGYRYDTITGLYQQELNTLMPYTIFEKRITAEQIQDLPGSDGVAVKPKAVWTCNRVIEHFGKLMIWGSQEMKNSVFYSFPDRPAYFPQNFYLDFGNDPDAPIEAITAYQNILIVQNQDVTWGIRGNSGLLTAPAPYVPFTVNTTVGTVAWKSVRPVRNQLFFLSKQGIIALRSLYAVDEQYNIDFVDLNIRNIVDRTDTNAVGIQYDNQYWLNFPKSGITLRYYIDKKAWVQDRFNSWSDFNGVFKYQVVNGELEFITYPSAYDSGVGVYKIGVDYSLPTDLFGDVVAFFETSYLNQNYPFHPKNYKETKMDFTIQNEYNLGREPIYQMETNEHITGNVTHTIQNPPLKKNHRYTLTYNFSEYDLEVLDMGNFTDTQTITLDFNLTFDGLDLGFFNLLIESILLDSKSLPFTALDENNLEIFLDNSSIPTGADLIITGDFAGYNQGASLVDTTYDSLLDFKTWVVSEEKTLNLYNIENYDQAKADIPVQIGTKLGDWVFGLSDFGNKVTAVKTIKLSGKGYNAKVYFEDYSKSKWTMESLGITYKMKRPRSR